MEGKVELVAGDLVGLMDGVKSSRRLGGWKVLSSMRL